MARAKKNTAGWKSRIVGHDTVDPRDLVPNPLNHRLHPAKQQAALDAAISEVGFIRSVTVNKTTGNLVDGHERLAKALRENQPTIDVEYVELSPEEERLALATLDKIAELAEVDANQLDALLRETSASSEALQGLLAEMATSAGLYLEDKAPPDATEQELGDVYQILIDCDGEVQQAELLGRFQEEGLKCRSLIA